MRDEQEYDLVWKDGALRKVPSTPSWGPALVFIVLWLAVMGMVFWGMYYLPYNYPPLAPGAFDILTPP